MDNLLIQFFVAFSNLKAYTEYKIKDLVSIRDASNDQRAELDFRRKTFEI